MAHPVTALAGSPEIVGRAFAPATGVAIGCGRRPRQRQRDQIATGHTALAQALRPTAASSARLGDPIALL